MRRLCLLLSLLFVTFGVWAQTNYATIQWKLHGIIIYRIDTKTNLTDKWYPHSGLTMCSNYNTITATYDGPQLSTNLWQITQVTLPISSQAGFFRLYTLKREENAQGIVWPTTNSVPVPFTLTLHFVP